MRIRPIEQTVAVGSGNIRSQASPQDFGAGVGVAMDELGQRTQRAGSVFDRLEEEKDQMWAANVASEKQLAWYQDLQARKTDPDFANQYGPDGAKFTEKYQESLKTDAETTILSAPSGRAQQYLQRELAAIQTNLTQHAITFQAQTGGEYVKSQMLQSLDNDAKMVSLAPEEAGRILARGKQNIENLPYLTPDQKMEMGRVYEQNIAFAAGMGQVMRNPEGVLATVAPDQMAKFYPTARVLQNPAIPVTSFSSVDAEKAKVLQPFNPITQQMAAQYGVDPAFMQAQQLAESGGNPNAQSPVAPSTGQRSIGLTQFQPATAARYGIDPTKPDQAIKGQAMYMSDLLQMFGGDYRKAAAAYNWGEGNVTNAIAKYGDTWMDHAPAETKGYLNRIFSLAPPLPEAQYTLAERDAMQNDEPMRAGNLPDWFNKLDWKQQMQIVDDAQQGVRANQVRDAQALANAEKQRDLFQKQTMNEMYDALLDNKLSADDVRRSPLDYQGKAYMLEALAKGTKQELKTDPAVFQNVFQRIHADDKDPNRITDEKDLLPYLGKGLSFEDLKRLRDEVNGKHTFDGQMASELKKNFFTMARKQIDTSIFGQSIDTEGARKFYLFQQAVLATIDRKTKKGVDILDLFDPNSKEYLGNMIPQYQRDINQQMKDMSAAYKGPAKTALPRQPGESAADYLARTGGQ
jgi:soluble lytic murein transglycosylase-like protein